MSIMRSTRPRKYGTQPPVWGTINLKPGSCSKMPLMTNRMVAKVESNINDMPRTKGCRSMPFRFMGAVGWRFKGTPSLAMCRKTCMYSGESNTFWLMLENS